MISSLIFLAALAPLALAAVHNISVGGLLDDGTPNLSFRPNNIQAAIGDTVLFTYYAKNHSVTQSSFSEPCSKLGNSHGEPIGFDSGFIPVPAPDSNFPTFEITVNDTKPIWGYCRQVNPPNATHCQAGMVFAINAATSENNTFSTFLANAKASTEQNASSPSSSSVVATSTSASWSGAPASTSAAYPATHTIIVGGDAGFTYSPPNITANVGDKVFFSFRQKNHTVTQTSFDPPCREIADTSNPLVHGFDSGFMPVAPNSMDFPNFTMVINDTKPIWGYCRQQAANFSHCGVGMVFSINASPYTEKSFDAFQQLAVHQNGSGYVDPFGNLTTPPVTAYGSGSVSGSGYGSGSNNSSKNAQDLDTLSSDGTESGSTSDKLNILLDTYAPAALGLLGGAFVLLLAVLVVGIMLLRRSSQAAARRVGPNYHPVPLDMPSSKVMDDGSHDYEESRYSNREHTV